MSAINHLREGYIEYAAHSMDVTLPIGCPHNIEVNEYNPTNTKLWHADMKKLIALLKKHKL